MNQVSGKRKRRKMPNDEANAYWSLGEKEKFLRALKQHGLSKNSDSLKKISNEIGTKSVKQVAHYVSRRGLRSNKCSTCEVRKTPPIDIWLDNAKRNMSRKLDFTSALEKVFEECVQEEFKEIYRFILPMLKNEYPPDMSADSAEILIRLMTDLAGVIHNVGIDDIIETVNKYQQNDDSYQQNSSSAKISDPTVSFYETGFVDGGGDLTTLNPLHLSPKLLEEIYTAIKEKIDAVHAT